MRKLELATEQTNLEKMEGVEETYGVEQDPELIVRQGLVNQLAIYDRVKAETGHSKFTILTAFKKYKLGSNADIAKFHYDLKQDTKQSTFSLGSDFEMALKMEVAKAVEQGSIAKSFKKDPILTFKEYCVVAYIATKYAVLRVR